MSSNQKITSSSKIVPHLWFEKDADQAAKFYASIFPDSRVDRVAPLPADTPSGPAGSVSVVEFTLAGQPFMAISAGPLDPFNHAISFMVNCADQAEIDRYGTRSGPAARSSSAAGCEIATAFPGRSCRRCSAR